MIYSEPHQGSDIVTRCTAFNESENSFLLFAGFILCPLIAVLGIFALLIENHPIGLIPLLFGLWGCPALITNYAAKTSEYSVNAHGITVRLIGRFQTTCSWEDIDSIVLCDLVDRQMNVPFPIVLRIAVCKEKHGPLSREKSYSIMGGWERWHGYTLWLNHPRTIICIDYSEETLHEISALSGREIPQKWSSRERCSAAYKLYQSLNQEEKP